jgi:hypothetical protein
MEKIMDLIACLTPMQNSTDWSKKLKKKIKLVRL